MDSHLDPTSPTISVIMPVYNGGDFLTSSIQSVLDQTYKDFELIIINDGSTDHSSDILSQYAKLDKRIRLIERDNRGLVYSLNEGIALSRGNFIARMDSDDISLPLRFEKQIELLENEDADICGSHYFVISIHSKKLIPILCPLTEHSVILHLSGSSVPFAHGSVMMRKAFLIEKGLTYNADFLAEDYNLWLSFYFNKAKFANVDDFLFGYRIHSNSITGNITSNLRNDGKKLGYTFLKRESFLCKNAISIVLSQEPTEIEEILLVVASYRLFKLFGDNVLYKVLKKISFKSKAVGMIKIFSGKA